MHGCRWWSKVNVSGALGPDLVMTLGHPCEVRLHSDTLVSTLSFGTQPQEKSRRKVRSAAAAAPSAVQEEHPPWHPPKDSSQDFKSKKNNLETRITITTNNATHRGDPMPSIAAHSFGRLNWEDLKEAVEGRKLFFSFLCLAAWCWQVTPSSCPPISCWLFFFHTHTHSHEHCTVLTVVAGKSIYSYGSLQSIANPSGRDGHRCGSVRSSDLCRCLLK